MLNLESLRPTIKTNFVKSLENSKGKLTVTSLLASNMKLDKGNAFVTGLTLAPFKVINLFSNTENVNYCVNGKECFKTCLFNQAGRFGMGKNENGFSLPQLAGIKRALLFKENKAKFYKILFAEIALKVAEIEENETLYIRLNVMSDIDHSEIKAKINASFENVVIYDYTKRIELITENTAFSMTNKGISLGALQAVLSNNAKISVIVTKEDKQRLLEEFTSQVIDGDKHDLFFLENGLFTLLAPKGLSNKQKTDLNKNMTVSYTMIKDIIKLANNLKNNIAITA